jgi:hypothetical protein
LSHYFSPGLILFFLAMVLRFELTVLCLLGRCSTT